MGQSPQYAWSRAAPALRGLVSGYSGYRTHGPPGVHHGLPSGHLTLVVCLSGTLDVVGVPGRSGPPRSFTSAVGGLHDGPVVMSHDGHQHGVQLDLTWRGARALLGLPASELAGDVADLTAMLGARAGELAERLSGAPTWRGRFRVLDDVLAELVDHRRDGPPPEVAQAWRRLRETGGRLPIAVLARELGWSRRHLGERFRRETGLSPKTAARVIRFERACRLLRSPRPPSLAETAAECGYFDQAHLAREFRDLGGTTATRWLGEFPSVQDRAAGPEPR
ncbi:AraC family transcriptional regulator [Nonomuraea aridisoli]|uniref:AraC family transcriptional regulator n=1 Tax=Nonomuraea aridisoli TaxID=2070368 RepID=A0A2W2EMR7_9ACTN|nr:helix-turn-helix domain-containing protein [Nonomuraea aridisoli]PZG23703.1 AraC family transcriptional regulator [Nonomuraea aridisoli]